MNKNPQYVPTFAQSRAEAEANPNANIMGLPQSFDGWVDLKPKSDAMGTPWENKISLQSPFYMSKFETTTWIHQISPTPLLYVADKQDEFMPYQLHLDAFARGGGTKKVV